MPEVAVVVDVESALQIFPGLQQVGCRCLQRSRCILLSAAQRKVSSSEEGKKGSGTALDLHGPWALQCQTGLDEGTRCSPTSAISDARTHDLRDSNEASAETKGSEQSVAHLLGSRSSGRRKAAPALRRASRSKLPCIWDRGQTRRADSRRQRAHLRAEPGRRSCT